MVLQDNKLLTFSNAFCYSIQVLHTLNIQKPRK